MESVESRSRRGSLGETRLYFRSEKLVNYVLSLKQKPEGKLDSKVQEIIIGLALLWIYQRDYPEKDFVLGFPIKDKYVSRYKGRKEDLTDAELAHFLESNEREEATFNDVEVRAIKDGKLAEGVQLQIKRFGEYPPAKTDEDLVNLLKDLEKNPKTGADLLINIKKFGLNVTVDDAYRWLEGKDYPFNHVTILLVSQRRNEGGRMFFRMINIYPKPYIHTFGMDLLRGIDPDPRIVRRVKNFIFVCRILKYQMSDFLKELFANTPVFEMCFAKGSIYRH